MPSTLGRLFNYAKAPTSSAIENFTTEALAGAVRDDPRPFAGLLRDAGHLVDGEGIVEVLTQVVLPGTGVLDLVARTDRDRELWLEVKVDAGESGTQLDRYLIAAHASGPAAVLLSLGKRPLRPAQQVPNLTWQALRAVVLSTVRPSPFWRDLIQFMAERGMADTYDEPITPAEAISQATAHSLLRKGVRILAATVRDLADVAPEIRWPATDRDVEVEALGKYLRKGRLFVVGATGRVLYPMVGFDHREAETMASVWLETKPSGLAMQRQVFDRATAVGLGPEWQRLPGRWGGLQVVTPVLELGDHRAVVRWFVERVIELRDAGLLALAVGAPAGGALEPADSADLDE